MEVGYVFDLDGVLIDSRDAVREAYKRVGCVMPDDAWGRPWYEWCGIEPHTRKVAVYKQMILAGEVPTLPPLEVLRELRDANKWVGIFTGASHEAVTGIMAREGLRSGVRLLGWSESKKGKYEILRATIKVKKMDVVCIDDEDLEPITGCRFVKYTGQSDTQLKEDIGWM
jgi:phosphoglycolate phosphatase-like HAD superfamily hydrolase